MSGCSRHDRRSFLRAIAASGCALATTTRGQSASSSLPRVGFLISEIPALINAFEGELRRLGWIDGRNFVLEKRIHLSNSAGPNGLSARAAELARMDLALVMVAALPQALAVREANPAMPMVIGTCPGLVNNGFAQSMQRPGGIYTGMDELPSGVTRKRLELLQQVAPRARRIALLSTTPGVGGHEAQVAEAGQAAAELALTVKPFRAATVAELDAALAAIAAERWDAMLNFQGGLSLSRRVEITRFAAENRLPAIYQSEFFVEDGGLMCWAPDQAEQFREGARYVDRILKGARPGDLPARYPSAYYLGLNRTAARRIGLELPAALVAQAHRVAD